MAKPVKFLLGAEGSEKLKATEEGRVYFALSDKGVINPNIYNLFYDNGNELIPIASESKYAEKASNADKAASADKWTTPRNISVTGDVEGTTTIDGSSDIAIPATLKSIVTAGTRGPSANATLAHGGKFTVPYIKYNAKGLVTAGATRTFTLPTETQLNKGTETSKQEALSHGGAFSAITGIDVSNHTITPTLTTFTLPSLTKGTDEAATAATLSHGGSFDVLIDTKTDGSSIIDVYKTFTLPTETQLSTGTATTNQSSLSHKGTFSAITGFTVNDHKITPTVTTFTLPADSNTDTKVTQKAETRDDNSYNVLLGGSTGAAAETGSVNKAGGFSYNPAEGAISLTDKNGNIGSIYAVAAKAITSESTATADKWTSPRNFKFTGDVQDVSKSVDGSNDVTWSLALDEIVTGATKGPSKDTTLTHSESFVVPSFTYDNKGRITSATNRTLTLPKVGVSDEFNNIGNLTPSNKTITFPSLVSTVTADSTSDIVVTKENFGIDLSDFALFSEIPKFLIFKGTLSARDGDIPDLDTPTAEMEGWVYIVTYAGGYSNTDVHAKVGDLFICANRGSDGYKWVHVPSSDSYAAESNHSVTADKWTTGRTISLTKDVSGTSSAWDGSGNLSISATLSNSGVTAGKYGPSDNVSPAHGGSFTVPYLEVDAKGRATAASNKTITLPTYGLASASANGLMPKEEFEKLSKINIAYATCSTAAATATKVVSIKDGVKWELKTGAVVVVVFSYTNTASSPKLNVNNTGAKSIMYEGSVLGSSNKEYGGTAKRPMIFIYDGTNYRFAGWGYDGNTNTQIRIYRQTTGYNADYPLIVSRTAAGDIATVNDDGSYEPVYGVMWDDTSKVPTLNPSTGEIKAVKFTGAFNGTANHATTADKWVTPRTITYTGDATGSVTFDGSADATCQLTVGDKWVNTTGDTMSGNLIFSNADTISKTQPVIKWKTFNNQTPYIGYCSQSGDGTFLVGSLVGTKYTDGLAIGGSSGNLLWKGTKVATINDKVAAATTADSANSANYATSAGSADSAQKDGSGNVITTKYVTVDTTQTISGAKTFSNAITTIQNKLQLNRSGGVAQGRISFYDPSYNTWFEYMTDTAAGGCPTGAAASTYGDVTSWARRSLIENISGYGWVWEACANGATTTPLPIMSLSSSTGKLAVSGAIAGASSASFSGLITQGIPASHSTINNMNKFQSDLFVEGNGSAPNSPVKPGFYLGKSTSDENRHMDIVSGADYSYIDFNKASREEDYAVRLIANVSNGLTQFSWGSTSAITDKRLQIAGALDVTGGITGTLTGRITHPGISSSWWNGRINALVTQTSVNGYNPIMSMKTTNGSWEVGHYNSGGYHNDFLINYKDDSTYNSSNNSVVHAVKIKKEGNIVLNGTDIALNSGSGTMRYNTTTKSIDFIFA